ncbi:MAG: DUF5674 family protein [Candidatus Gastranaerophilales bacterium]|nr:DUF5674 family protein [Candidatus Gastranaerophilales bacterium]
MLILTEKLTLEELRSIAKNIFGEMVKGVVDVDKGILAIDAELHADIEAELLQQGSAQASLWGINLYPDEDDFIEFDSMINIRPSQNNRSRSVENEAIRSKIISIVNARISI